MSTIKNTGKKSENRGLNIGRKTETKYEKQAGIFTKRTVKESPPNAK